MSGTVPEKALDTTAENPWPVRLLAMKINDYINRMSPVWVEGQVIQSNIRDRYAYLTLRDADAEMSMSVSLPIGALNALGAPLTEGQRVVVHAKPSYWLKRGTFSLDGRQIRAVGVGDLLARIEALGRTLQAEGLFDQDRKRPLPRIPQRIGLITGRASAAERDVVENTMRRWPAAQFEIREVAVQGVNAVTEVVAALRELDAHRGIDVIVIARGGGALEELLPFSNEAMVRAVAQAVTPVVSAIGHEVDRPLLDLVADKRASTPTDAAKLLVPDAAVEAEVLLQARRRAWTAVTGNLAQQRDRLAAARERMPVVVSHRVAAERRQVESLHARPVMADPSFFVTQRREPLEALRARALRRVESDVHRHREGVEALAARVRALSPQSTLERGYAVVQHVDGRVVMRQEDVHVDELLRVRVAEGDFAVRAVGAPDSEPGDTM